MKKRWGLDLVPVPIRALTLVVGTSTTWIFHRWRPEGEVADKEKGFLHLLLCFDWLLLFTFCRSVKWLSAFLLSSSKEWQCSVWSVAFYRLPTAKSVWFVWFGSAMIIAINIALVLLLSSSLIFRHHMLRIDVMCCYACRAFCGLCYVCLLSSLRLWNQLPTSLRQPQTNLHNSNSPVPVTATSFSIDSPLLSSITSSLFHSRLKTFLFNKSFPP